MLYLCSTDQIDKHAQDPVNFSLSLSLSLSLSVMALTCPAIKAQTANTLSLPVTINNGTTQVGSIDTAGATLFQGGFSTGTTSGGLGQITLYGAGTMGGSLNLTAPSAFLNGTTPINQTWTFPYLPLPSGLSLLQLSSSGSTGTMNYATLAAGSGLVLTQSSGSIMFSLSNSLNLGSMTMSAALNDSAGHAMLGLSSTGTTSNPNYITIANDYTTGTPPSGPLLHADGTPAKIPLQLADKGGAGILLESNGALAVKVLASTTPVNQYLRIDATPSLSTFAGGVGTQILSGNSGGTSDVSLALKAQGNGYVAMQSNVDSASAYAFEQPADTTMGGVTKGLLVMINSSGNAINATATAAHGVVGVALNTTSSSSVPAVIATSGRVNCTFVSPGTQQPGHYVQLVSSGSTNGLCQDAGASYSSSYQIIGTVLDTSGNIILRIGN